VKKNPSEELSGEEISGRLKLRQRTFRLRGFFVSSEESSSEESLADDLIGSVGSITDLIPKGPGFESQISHGFSLM
jgi:hypothetical protein